MEGKEQIQKLQRPSKLKPIILAAAMLFASGCKPTNPVAVSNNPNSLNATGMPIIPSTNTGNTMTLCRPGSISNDDDLEQSVMYKTIIENLIYITDLPAVNSVKLVGVTYNPEHSGLDNKWDFGVASLVRLDGSLSVLTTEHVLQGIGLY